MNRADRSARAAARHSRARRTVKRSWRSSRRDRPLRVETLERRLVLACPSLPVTATIRGKAVQFDQCYSQPFTEAAVNYEVQVFYTETNSATNQAQCDASDGAARCEHAIADVDDAAGNNLVAVAMAAEGQAAFQFYLRRNLKMLSSGGRVLEIYIANDPGGGGLAGNGIMVDDEWVDNSDTLQKRLLAYHEVHHMVQVQYDGSWHNFYGEGAARAIEDRVDVALDADLGHLFIPEVDTLLASDVNRASDLLGISYQSVLWWTWLMDQYRNGAGVDPPVTAANDLGWSALREFYLELETQQSDELGALGDFIADQGGTFRDDFIDYTLALYAFKYNPSDRRLGFFDAEINARPGLSGHNVISGGTPFTSVATNMNPRSSRYWEFDNASSCDYTGSSFDGNGLPYGFSVMTVDGGDLADRWTSYSNSWARTVRTADLDRVVGVVSAFDQSGSVDVRRGCVEPTIDIKSPTSASFASVGRAGAPRTFIVRLDVSGEDGSGVEGLTADAFSVTLTKAGGGPALSATVVNSVYVLDDYWLLVQAPSTSAGAENGAFYDLTVSLDASVTDTKSSAVLYDESTQDVMIVLDRSGSMGGSTGKLAAAKNAAALLVNQLTSNDQAGYVRFATNAGLRVALDHVTADHRDELVELIMAETASGNTSIGDGLDRALTEHLANRDPENECSFIVLSDGHENEPQRWDDVEGDVIERGCAVHTVAFGPEANEPLMQEIAESVTGGTYDYATTSGTVEVASFLDWRNNLGRVWDDIGTELGRRQRVGTAAMQRQAGRLDFEDLPATGAYPTGGAFVTGDVTVVGIPFFPLNSQTPIPGVAVVEDDLRSGGSGQDLALRNTSVAFAFNRTMRDLSFQFNEWGGSTVNLWINGQLLNVVNLSQLDGLTVDGVGIRVELFGEFSHLLTLDGPIESFAVGGQDLVIDNLNYASSAGQHLFLVDGLSDQLVLTLGWQAAAAGLQTTLFDPLNNQVSTAFRRRSSGGTNEVWTIPSPIPGYYRLVVNQLNQQYFATGAVRSHLELHAFTGGDDRAQGVRIPLLASFIAAANPLPGATIVATVRAPNGTSRVVELYDDGNHGDSLPNDGVYGNWYTRTSAADETADDPVEGQDPRVVGSYRVDFVATLGAIRREAHGAFAVRQDADKDGDGLPDGWERANGMDPSVPDDDTDHDGDGLNAICEFQFGLDPRNSDTDGGGERDGSEVQCSPRTERVDPRLAVDDRGGPLSSVVAHAEADVPNGPFVRLTIGAPLSGDLEFSRIERRAFSAAGDLIQDWTVLRETHTGRVFLDTAVVPKRVYEYRVAPQLKVASGSIGGRVEISNRVTVLEDPYAPGGSLLINGGEIRTTSPIVTLHMSADDRFGDSHVPTELHPVPFTPISGLEMRLSNDATFRNAAWEPFRSVVNAWRLDAAPGDRSATVHVQFRDSAGNVSRPESDSIILSLQPGDTFPFNGCVQVFDLNNVRNNFGENVAIGRLGDAIGSFDGMVNLDDLNLVRNHFGEGICTPAAGESTRNFDTSPAAATEVVIARSTAAVDVLFGMWRDREADTFAEFKRPRSRGISIHDVSSPHFWWRLGK